MSEQELGGAPEEEVAAKAATADESSAASEVAPAAGEPQLEQAPSEELAPIPRVVTPPPPTEPQNVRVDSECREPLKAGQEQRLQPTDYLNVLRVSQKHFIHSLESYPNVNIVGGTNGVLWKYSLEEALPHNMPEDAFRRSLERKESDWAQVVEHEGERLTAGKPQFGDSDTGPLTGERAIIKASAVMGLGSLVQIPLWHTGAWISFKAPSDASLLELERRLAEEKVDLGRRTNGLVFSNTSVYLTSYIVNFALRHVYDSSIQDLRAENLKSIIKVTDIPSLLWGLACTIYPNGYPYAQPCTDDPEKCQHVSHELLKLNKLLFVDTASLSAYQRKLMTRRRSRFSAEELNRYQEEHIHGNPRVIQVQEGSSIRLKVPTIAQYEESGFAWVDGIERMLTEAFGQSLRGEERNQYMIDQGNVTRLRQYSHWVDAFLLEGDKGKVDEINDRETLEELMSRLSTNKDLCDHVLDEIAKYIDDSTIAMIAIPMYACPACGASQVPKDSPNKNLIPLNMAQVFFTLLRQRLSKALT